jgi:hypothetical protein
VRVVAAAACVVAAGCYHWAELTTTYGGAPERGVPLQHAVTVFASSNEALRRAMENHLAQRFESAAPSYRVLVTTDVADLPAVRRVFDNGAFDSAIIMSVVQTDGLRSFTPGAAIHTAPAPSFGREWARTWAVPFDPSKIAPKLQVAIEVRVYSLVDGRLVWAGRGDAGDARTVAHLADAATTHFPAELEREGLAIQEGLAPPVGPRPNRH